MVTARSSRPNIPVEYESPPLPRPSRAPLVGAALAVVGFLAVTVYGFVAGGADKVEARLTPQIADVKTETRKNAEDIGTLKAAASADAVRWDEDRKRWEEVRSEVKAINRKLDERKR